MKGVFRIDEKKVWRAYAPAILNVSASRTKPRSFFQRSSVLQVRRLTAYFEMCLSARRRIGSTVSRLSVYSIVFPSLWLVTSPQNARHLRLWEAIVCSILRACEISPTFFGLFLSRLTMPTRYSFERALNSKETAVTSVFRRGNCWLMNGLCIIALSAIKLSSHPYLVASLYDNSLI